MPKKKEADINNLKKLFEFNKKYYENKLQKTFPDISLIMAKGASVVIYGAAEMGAIFRTNLAKNGINILAFADRNTDLWGKKIEGIRVISPEELKESYPNQPILVASLLHETEICEMLHKRRFPLVYPLCLLNYKYPDIFVSSAYFQQFGSLFIPENQSDILKVNGFWEDKESRRVFYNIVKFRLTFDKSCLKAIKSKSKQYFEPDIFVFCSQRSFFGLRRLYRRFGSTVL